MTKCIFRVVPQLSIAICSLLLPTSIPGAPDHSLSFNGNNSYAETSKGVIPSSGDFTVECWALCSTAPGSCREILSQGSAGNSLYIGTDSNNNLRLGDGWGAISTSIPYPLGGWHQFAIVKAATNTYFYLDGTNRINRGQAIANPAASTGLRFGRQYGSYGEYWPGNAGDVRIWSRALSASEIQSSLTNTLAGNESGLLAWWRFNEGTGTTCVSLGSTNVVATLINGPVFTSVPYVLTGLASGRDQTSATLTGAVAPGNLSTMTWFEWGTTTNYGKATAVGNLPAGNASQAVSAVLTSLQAGQAYHFRVVATNAVGLTRGADQTLLIQKPIVTTAPATRISATSATLFGMVNPGFLATRAWFEWGTTTNYGNTSDVTNLPATATSWGVSAVLTNLTPGQTYFFHIVATNSEGLAAGQCWKCVLPPFQLRLLGDNPLNNRRHKPFIDPGVEQWAAPTRIAAGAFHNLALKTDGTVFAWGDNSSGQTNVPVSATNLVAISAGANYNLALKADGTVIAWGENTYGQTNIPVSATNTIGISAGTFHCLALKADGTVTAWGYNGDGQTNVPASATNVVAIAAGTYCSLALKADGTVIAWGENAFDMTNAPACATNVVAIAAGAGHNLALKADGTVIAWGYYLDGQTSVPASATNIVAIAAPGNCSLALKADGSLLVWGDDTYDQYNVPAAATNIVAIAGGGFQNLALRADGTLLTWGTNPFAFQINTPTNIYFPNFPVTVTGVVDTNTLGIYPLNYSLAIDHQPISCERTVAIVDTPDITGLTARFAETNAAPGSRSAVFSVSVWPNGLATTAFFQFGAGSGFPAGTPPINLPPVLLPAVFASSNLVVSLDGLAPGFTEHWKVVVSNALGQAVSPEQTLTVPAPLPGDLNGDGRVSADEAATVMQSYWGTTTNQITGLTSAGPGKFQFGLTNATGLNFTVLFSTNLTDWEALTNAAPQFLFSDPSCTNAQQRYYRLRWP